MPYLNQARGASRAGSAHVQAKTADYTVTTGESGGTFTNAGAAGIVTFSLPAATVGLTYEFYVKAAFALRIDPNGTQTIGLPGTNVQQAAGKYITCATVGGMVRIRCVVAGTWDVETHQNTFTAEA